jgi:hypothetical protein
MLSNIVFVIILILLVIILVLLYFFSNDIRKNKNKLNICESDIQALRERVTSLNQKIGQLENIEYKPSKNNVSFDSSQPDFVNLLEKLGSMNQGYYNADDEDVYVTEDD